MLKEEFEKLAGLKCSDYEYDMANVVYMSTNHDKEPFCQMWKSASGDAKSYMYEMALKMDRMAGKINRMEGIRVQYAEFIVKYDGKIFPNGCSDAEELMGKKWVVMFKLTEGISLEEYEIEWLRNHVKE